MNSPRQGAEELLMDADRRKCFCVTFVKSNKTAVSGTQNRKDWRRCLLKRTISVMVGKGSLNHNSRKFHAKNTDPERSCLNIEYCNEDIRDVYHELFDDALERYNARQTRKDRCIDDYYEKIASGKQEKPFHEMIIQIGNKDDMSAITEDGRLAEKILDEYMQDFQKRNPMLRVFSAHLHMDEATPHLHIDFVPFTTGSKRGLDARVSFKQALKAMGIEGCSRMDTEWNQLANAEKEALAAVMERYDIEWEKKGTHEKHLHLLEFEKQERAKEVVELEKEKTELEEGNALLAQDTEDKLAYLETVETDIENELEKKEKAEKAAQKAEEKWKKYEKQYNRYTNISNNVKAYAGDFSRPEEMVPDPDFLESAKMYRNRKIMPLMDKMRDLLLGLYQAYLEIQKKMEKVERRNEHLERSNNHLTWKNQDLEQCVERMGEDVKDYHRLRRVVGEEYSDTLIQGERNREIAEKNAQKILRKRHDREAR